MEHPTYTLLLVDNPVASGRFYADLLGIEPVDASETFVLFALRGGLMLGLWSRHTVTPPAGAPAGAAELGFRLADAGAVDAACADWRARGIPIAAAPADLDFGRSFLALDPDGHRLRVYALAA